MRTRLRVKEVAESKNFNMSSLSKASNISFNTIKRLWTRPYEGAKIDTLLRIARVLDVQVTDLLEELED